MSSASAAPPSASRRSDWRAGLWPLLVILLLGLPSLQWPYGADQAMFACIARVWSRGDLPYRDAWDVKPPGIFADYRLGLALSAGADVSRAGCL